MGMVFDGDGLDWGEPFTDSRCSDQSDGGESNQGLDPIQTFHQTRFGDYITSLSREKMRQVREAIAFAPGFDALED